MLSNVSNYFAGDTVRVDFEFRDFDGSLVDPDVVKFKTYDSGYNLLDEVTLGSGNRASTGIYYYDYVTDDTYNGYIVYEIYGEIATKPSLKREKIKVSFYYDS